MHAVFPLCGYAIEPDRLHSTLTKNRLHIDLHGPAGELDTEVERLRALGAQIHSHVKEPSGEWVVMTDPEGNEFCVH